MPKRRFSLAESGSSTGKPPESQAPVIHQMLTGDGTFATTLLVFLLDRFPEVDEDGHLAVLKWHPDTIHKELEGITHFALPKRNFDRLMAAIAVLTTDFFFKDVARFIILANILAGDDDFAPDEFNPATVADCAWAVTEALLLVPPDEQDPEPFSDDVRRYIGHALLEEGFIVPPDILRIAIDADWTEQVTYSFAEDPEFFGAIHEMQTSKTEEITSLIREGLRTLLAQLKALPLRVGSTKDIEKRLRQMIRPKDKEASR